MSWTWYHTPINPALRRLRQEDPKFEANLRYTAKPPSEIREGRGGPEGAGEEEEEWRGRERGKGEREEKEKEGEN